MSQQREIYDPYLNSNIFIDLIIPTVSLAGIFYLFATSKHSKSPLARNLSYILMGLSVFVYLVAVWVGVQIGRFNSVMIKTSLVTSHFLAYIGLLQNVAVSSLVLIYILFTLNKA